jgi:hypothetical protein
MARDALVFRIAHLERAYEQIDKWLGLARRRMASLEHKVDHGFTQLRAGIHRTSRWVIGVILLDWVTLMLAVLLYR